MKIQDLKGAGPKTVQMLHAMGIHSIADLIRYYPRTYEDRSVIKRIDELEDGEFTGLHVEVVRVLGSGNGFRGKNITRILFRNESGNMVGIWFNQPYMKNSFKAGEKVFLYGKVSIRLNELQMLEPQFEKDQEESPKGILPVYTLGKSMSQKQFRKLVKQALMGLGPEEDFLSQNIRKVFELPDLSSAWINIHFPTDASMVESSVNRLKFDELLLLQLGLGLAKREYISGKQAPQIPGHPILRELKEELGFTLTGAQSRAVREILSDMKRGFPMNRLVQGDVGSGKTIVAVLALMNAAASGFQGAMMVPTEILAEQHFAYISRMAEKHGIRAALLRGSTSQKEKTQIRSELLSGEISIIIGTHALIQDGIEFKSLALVVTDEQHRFGVRQRALLINKGANPHVLVMTATPIPRTLALFVYSDMDMSIIDELPPGRKEIETYFIKSDKKERMYDFVKKQLDQGRQAYIICPLVEESEKLELSAAVETYEILSSTYFSGYRIGLLHGKMTPSEKEGVMQRFKAAELDVLVATTVVEVGVNVPNATIMAIENAERFGLSQLHQLRGRVGRGEHQSYCILISDAKGKEFGERMKIMTKTNDGFQIADKDMELRGTGEFFGLRQHGLPELRLADLTKDIGLVKKTRDLAVNLISEEQLMLEEHRRLREQINQFMNEDVLLMEGGFN